MANPTRWLAPAVLAAALGVGSLAVPAQAQAQDALTRVLVDIADVVLRGGQPYYRHGSYGYDDRLIVERDRYGNPVYYRRVPADHYRRSGPPYGVAHGYYRNGPGSRDVRRTKCNKHGKCKVEYYDPRYDRRYDRYGHYDRYDRHDRYDRDRWDD
ncbi:hypothetical protein GCM10028862_19140 [Luteimonas pelagia]